MKITMKNLADMLGVSRTTVSLAQRRESDAARISPRTRELILAKAEELQFPNYFATALNKGRTGTIGVVFPDVFEEYMSAMVAGMEDVFTPKDRFSCFPPAADNSEQQIVRQLLHRGVDV